MLMFVREMRIIYKIVLCGSLFWRSSRQDSELSVGVYVPFTKWKLLCLGVKFYLPDLKLD